MVEFIVQNRPYIYLLVTILLVLFLYSYVYYMYKCQRTGKRDYEKYARLALDDGISDMPIEAKLKDKGDR